MPTPGQELSTIDYSAMIGGPLVAVIEAQAQAAISTVNFIKQVGFKPATDDDGNLLPTTTDAPQVGDPVMVTFKYKKETAPYTPAVLDDSGAVTTPAQPAVYEELYLTVPFLTLIPIPFIRIEEATIEFNAKITSLEYKKTDSSFAIDAELEAKAGWLWGSAKLKVTTAYKRSTQAGNQVDRTYSLSIVVKAKQDDMPAGMEKVLGILEEQIKGTPVNPNATP